MVRGVQTRFETPLGEMVAVAVAGAEPDELAPTGCGLCMLEFDNPPRRARELEQLARAYDGADLESDDPDARRVLNEARRQVDAYFAGDRSSFDLPLVLPGTPFQRSVWNELLKIPFASTISYGELATKIDNKDASRAVGAANGANRVAIVVPCHRVIDASGGLHGYGGGLERKRWLLDHEAGDKGTLFEQKPEGLTTDA